MRRIIAFIFILLALTETASSAFLFGLSFDTSSNMLMRPDSPSGTITNFYSKSNMNRGKFDMSYWLDAGIVEKYQGIQFHRHSVDATYTAVSTRRSGVFFSIEGALARYGEVTVINGYHEFGTTGTVKSYIMPSTLLRLDGTIKKREFRNYTTEDFIESDTCFRIDRFLPTETTLRGQIGIGLRNYTDTSSSKPVSLLDTKVRVAQSLGPKTGIWTELQLRRVDSDAVIKTAFEEDRLFLDNRYMSSLSGGSIHVKHLLTNYGKVQFDATFARKDYNENQIYAYWYLPENGWREWDIRTFFTFSYKPELVPDRIHPSIQLYYINVDATLSELSFNSSGVNLRLEFY